MQLVYQRPDGTEAVVPVDRCPFTIGRSPDADLRIENEFGGVSRLHCRIVEVEDGYGVEDLKSRNGTIVNGQETRSCLLNDGDVIELSSCRLVVRDRRAKGVQTIMMEVGQKMEEGAGYSTMLRGFVDEASKGPKPRPPRK
jgi:pSer/pThr/pTyr-binding forkhead associated (FHA) protein